MCRAYIHRRRAFPHVIGFALAHSFPCVTPEARERGHYTTRRAGRFAALLVVVRSHDSGIEAIETNETHAAAFPTTRPTCCIYAGHVTSKFTGDPRGRWHKVI